MARLTNEMLEIALRANPGAKAADLCASLKIEQSTLSRALKRLRGRVIALGKASRTRYAWRRALRGRLDEIPLYRIDRVGRGEHVGSIDCTYPGGTAVRLRAELGWPLDDDMRDGWYEGVPYWMMDMRPQGFLGRNFAKRYARELQIPEDPTVWSDDDILHILATIGSDQPGNLVLGDAAYEALLESTRDGGSGALEKSQIPEAYPALAAQALASGVTGSSAGGEFPKFTACRVTQGEYHHVIVKFSGAGASAAETRWSDLLVSEHNALLVLQEVLEVPAARSEIHRFDGRTFLEVERFDRHGLLGRSELCSLASVNAALIGAADQRWPALAESLLKLDALNQLQTGVISLLWWFGRLIGNSDMHLGNLAFAPGLAVAPAYDMLPMRYAPLRGGELPGGGLEVPGPLPRDNDVWDRAAEAAIAFWERCASDTRISGEFRSECASNASLVGAARMRRPVAEMS